MAGPYRQDCPTPTSGKQRTMGQASSHSQTVRKEPSRRGKKQSACSAQGYGTRDARIRRGTGQGDIVEGLLFFLGRGLWWWLWFAARAALHCTSPRIADDCGHMLGALLCYVIIAMIREQAISPASWASRMTVRHARSVGTV